jgi:toxin HigB-1
VVFPYPPCFASQSPRWRKRFVLTYIDNSNALRYYCHMIKSFADSDTERVWNQQWIKQIPRETQQIAFRKLIMIHRSVTLRDLMTPPGNRLEKLTGNREGQMSIRINKRYRICFTWHNCDAYNVEIVDYH